MGLYRSGGVRLRWRGTRRRVGAEVTGQQENAVGIQHASRPRSISSLAQYKCYQLTRPPRLQVVDWTVAHAESHGLVRFAERRNLVSAHVPSNLNCTIPLVETSRKPLCAIVLYAMNFASLLFTLISPLGKTRRLTHRTNFRADTIRGLLNCVRKEEVILTHHPFGHTCTLHVPLLHVGPVFVRGYCGDALTVLHALIRCQFHHSNAISPIPVACCITSFKMIVVTCQLS
jgi:hypothetical protein